MSLSNDERLKEATLRLDIDRIRHEIYTTYLQLIERKKDEYEICFKMSSRRRIKSLEKELRRAEENYLNMYRKEKEDYVEENTLELQNDDFTEYEQKSLSLSSPSSSSEQESKLSPFSLEETTVSKDDTNRTLPLCCDVKCNVR